MLRENKVSLISFTIAVGLAAVIWLFLPHDREVKSLGVFLFKLLPFVFASLAISTVKKELFEKYNLQYILIIASFLGFFCYLVPKIIFNRREFDDLYYVLLVTTPYVILSLILAYRAGGGSSEKCFRLSIALLLLMLSGLEDLAYFAVNYDPTRPPLPEVWDWVSHVTIFLGHPPTRNEIIVFAITHVILALIVLFFPFDKLWQRLKQNRMSSLTQEEKYAVINTETTSDRLTSN